MIDRENILLDFNILGQQDEQAVSFEFSEFSGTEIALLSPVNNATDVPTYLELSWEPFQGFNYYNLQVSTSDTFSTLLDNVIITSSVWTLIGLANNTTYYWRVRGANPEAPSEQDSVASVTISPSIPVVGGGSTTQLSAIVQTTGEASTAVVWESSNESILTVNSAGLVTGVAEGSASVTATSVFDPSKIDTVTVNVLAEGEVVGSPEGDLAAAKDFYNSTGGDNWDNNTGWDMQATSLTSNWHGVTVENGRLVSLDMYENNLVGTLPNSIRNWDKIRYFNVKQPSGDTVGSRLVGQIPNISTWTEIESLLFSGRDLKNPNIAPNSSQHPGKSDTSGNSFEGPLPDIYGNMTKLKYLEISGSRLTKMFHPSIGNCAELLQIHFNWNLFIQDDRPPAEINNCTKLNKMYLSRSDFDGVFPTINNLTDLRFLALNGGTFHRTYSGPMPDLSNNTKVREFTLEQPYWDGPWPQYFNNGSYTNLIGLVAPRMQGLGPLHDFTQIGQSVSLGRSLRTLRLSNTKLNGTIPPSILTQYQAILCSLDNNDFEGVIPAEYNDGNKVWTFHDWDRSRYIRIHSMPKMTGPIPYTLPNSQHHEFQNCNYSSCDPQGWIDRWNNGTPSDSTTQRLRTLRLDRNRLTYIHVVPLAQFFSGLLETLNYYDQKSFVLWDEHVQIIQTNQQVTGSDPLVFNLSAIDISGNSYQWRYRVNSGSSWSNLTDGGGVSGATTHTLTLTDAARNEGEYTLRITNSDAPQLSESISETITVTV